MPVRAMMSTVARMGRLREKKRGIQIRLRPSLWEGDVSGGFVGKFKF